MGVREKTGRGWVAEVFVPGTGKYITRSAATQREARVLFAEMTVAAAQGKAKPSTATTLGDLLAMYIDNLHGSASTIYDYRLRARRIPQSLTKLRLREVTPAKLDAYYRKLRKEGLSNRSVRNQHAIIRAALNQAVKWDMIGANPALRASPGPTGGDEGRVATEAEVAALLAAADANPKEYGNLGFAIRLAAKTGMRRSELAALLWSDINFEEGTVTVSRAAVDAGGKVSTQGTKTHATRVIPVGPALLAALKERRGIGTVLGASPRVLSNRLDALCEAVGIEGLGWHGFRHHAGTELAGVADLRTVADILGHSTLRTTERYVHARAARSRAAVDALDALGG